MTDDMKEQQKKCLVLYCESCRGPNAIRYRQNTLYVEEELNWVTLCPECKRENDENWEERWREYESSRG